MDQPAAPNAPSSSPLPNTTIGHPNSPPVVRLGLLALTVVVLLGIGAAFLLSRQSHSVRPALPTTRPSPPLSPAPSPTTAPGWTTLNSAACFISFSYPSSWTFTLTIERNNKKEHLCTYYLKSPADTDTTISVNTLDQDSVTTQMTTALATGPQTPISIPGADAAYRVTTTSIQDRVLESPFITIIITKGKKAYSLGYLETSAETKQIAEQIVSSFQLTGTDQDYSQPFKAYNMVNKTNDTIIQNDLTSISRALRDYQKDNSSYPSTLNDLLSGYIRTIPLNPYTKGVYDYQTDGKTYFRLNATDGSGEPVTVDSRQATVPYQMNILQISYLPIIGDQLDTTETGITASLAQMRQKVSQQTQATMKDLEEGSRYHGDRDAGAVASLNYSIVKSVEYLQKLPRSTNEIPSNPGIYRPDYNAILKNLNICGLVEQQGVNEVWLWGYHHGTIEPVESDMAGPYGDISNSEHNATDLPICAKTYVLYNYNYGRATADTIRSHVHQQEAVFRAVDTNLFAQFTTQCGTAYAPPNAPEQYTWNSQKSISSTCDNWHPDGSGTISSLSCARWGCTDEGYFLWWMHNIPGQGNTLTDNNHALRNWWDAIGNFDSVMAEGATLNKTLP